MRVMLGKYRERTARVMDSRESAPGMVLGVVETEAAGRRWQSGGNRWVMAVLVVMEVMVVIVVTAVMAVMAVMMAVMAVMMVMVVMAVLLRRRETDAWLYYSTPVILCGIMWDLK